MSEYNYLIRKYIPLETIPGGTIQEISAHLRNNIILMAVNFEETVLGKKRLNLKYVDFQDFNRSQILSIDMSESVEFEEGKPFEIGQFENLSGTITKREGPEETRIEIIDGEIRKVEKKGNSRSLFFCGSFKGIEAWKR